MNYQYKQYLACKSLWCEVISQAILDAKNKINNSENVNKTIKDEMGYFKSKNFQRVCAFAGVNINIESIEAELRTLHRSKISGEV